MSEWRTATIEDLALSHKSALATGPFGSAVTSKNFRDSGVPMLRGSNLSEDVGVKLDERDLVFLDPELAATFGRSTARRNDLVFTCWGTIGQIGLIDGSATFDEYIVSNKQMKLTPDPNKVDSLFLYYNMSQPSMIFEVQSRAIGSTIPGFNLGQLRSLKVRIPNLGEQRAIAAVLRALDDKIAANTKLISLIDAHMGLEYTATVLDSASALPLNDVADFHNRRRVPLSAREREQRSGDVPYYGASGIFGTVDTAIFDEPLVLVGEDGSVINSDGTPVTQYIWGPAWVNNHAHVLTGKGISTELLFLAIRRAQVASLVTGAVQPKINMGNLKRLTLEIPGVDRRGRLEQIVKAETASKRAAIEENQALAATRDLLLPQLMSGDLRVKDAEKVLENAGV